MRRPRARRARVRRPARPGAAGDWHGLLVGREVRLIMNGGRANWWLGERFSTVSSFLGLPAAAGGVKLKGPGLNRLRARDRRSAGTRGTRSELGSISEIFIIFFGAYALRQLYCRWIEGVLVGRLKSPPCAGIWVRLVLGGERFAS